MCTTHTDHLMEFDSKLFENIYWATILNTFLHCYYTVSISNYPVNRVLTNMFMF
jgi:hypothetical protein